ncbi:MAG: hypothetical protein KBD16_01345 [Candidatus Pacebacteria bacterium]|nr:hypothetical protein [Candidatus Paceibacterota bacterium]
MHESLDPRRDEYPRLLELEYRNPAQRRIIEIMLGDKAHDIASVKMWAETYLHRISDILDHPDREDVRVLAREGKYDEVARIVIDSFGAH